MEKPNADVNADANVNVVAAVDIDVNAVVNVNADVNVVRNTDVNKDVGVENVEKTCHSFSNVALTDLLPPAPEPATASPSMANPFGFGAGPQPASASPSMAS